MASVAIRNRVRQHLGLHWDMICDLRQDSEVRADGEVIYRDGKFLL
jgi:aminopeptidase